MASLHWVVTPEQKHSSAKLSDAYNAKSSNAPHILASTEAHKSYVRPSSPWQKAFFLAIPQRKLRSSQTRHKILLMCRRDGSRPTTNCTWLFATLITLKVSIITQYFLSNWQTLHVRVVFYLRIASAEMLLWKPSRWIFWQRELNNIVDTLCDTWCQLTGPHLGQGTACT